jgi:biopolymer transport protein ExbD
MARAKRCEEEFNPWPPFVDVFSSVILVLLLFILVTIVNVAYYMQFNAKSNSEAQNSSAKVDSLYRGSDITDMISLKKEKKVALDSKGNDSLFSGGKAEGNAMGIPQKEGKTEQSLKKDGNSLIVEYKSKEMFLTSKAKKDLESFIKAQKAKNKGAKFVISISQPTNIIGKTIPKQISIGRALSAKNAMKKMGVKLNEMKLKITKIKDKNYKFGYVKITVKK